MPGSSFCAVIRARWWHRNFAVCAAAICRRSIASAGSRRISALAGSWNCGSRRFCAMPITELLAYQWLAQNMQFRAVLSKLPHTSLAMQFEDFCHDPATRARELFAFLGWDFSEQTREFIQQSTSAGMPSLYGWCTGRRRYATVFRHSANICEAWRNELTDYEQSRIMSIASALPQFRRFWRE